MPRKASESLLFRADTSAQIGIGHVMRCLALAQAWHDEGEQATFAMALDVPALSRRLEAEGMHVARLDVKPGSTDDAEQTIRLAHELGARWVVVDGYHFKSDYQRAIKDSGHKLLLVDDNGDAEHYFADIVLNQNLHAIESLYINREPYTRLLLGTRYTLLRREFLKWREWKRDIPDVARNVLVTLGGGDPDNVTLKVIQALPRVDMDGLQAVVVVGAGNPHGQELQRTAHASRFPIRLESNPGNMAELMAWADIAVSGGGSTNWELAFMGLPSLVSSLAENQRAVAAGLEAARVAVNLGWQEALTPDTIATSLVSIAISPERRAEMSRCGQELVDGVGVNRVLTQLATRNLSFRPVSSEDCHLIWTWANDPLTREVSFSSGPISWEEHTVWFQKKLTDPQCVFHIVQNVSIPIGQIRFQIKGQEAVISVSIAPAQRGHGYSSQIIRSGSLMLFHTTSVKEIHAFIKHGNVASERAFSKAGYVMDGSTTIQGNESYRFVLSKDSGS